MNLTTINNTNDKIMNISDKNNSVLQLPHDNFFRFSIYTCQICNYLVNNNIIYKYLKYKIRKM